MRFNLKNKPSNQSDEVVDWFEGFEKELRAKALAYARHSETRLMMEAYLLVKEILGE